MRRHLNIIESFEDHSEEIVDVVPVKSDHSALWSDLTELSARLREYMSPDSNDIGVETGMQRAAEMLDNVLRRHEVK